jgi:hypothetical protein
LKGTNRSLIYRALFLGENMSRCNHIRFVVVAISFFSYSSLAIEHKLEKVFNQYIRTYEEKILAGHPYPIEFSDYKEGFGKTNVVKILWSLPETLKNKGDEPSILMIERIDDQGHSLPFLPKQHRHYYDFADNCLRRLHFYNQANWPLSFVKLNQCLLYLFGYHSWDRHFVILHQGKIYDIDTRSNGMSQRRYFTENFVINKHPELIFQFKVSFFSTVDNFIEFDRHSQFMEQYNFSNKGDAPHFQIPLHKFLKSLPD